MKGRKMFQRLKNFFDLSTREDLTTVLIPRPPRRYFGQWKGSRTTVSSFVSDEFLDRLGLRFERAIGAADVENGRLVPLATESVKRRGAKRLMDFALSYEDAEILYRVLGDALQDVRNRRARRERQEYLMSTIFLLLEGSRAYSRKK